MAVERLKQDLELEIVQSEIKRVRIFLLTLLISLVFSVVNYLFLKNSLESFFLDQTSLLILIGWFVVFFLYEIVILQIFRSRQKKGKRISAFFKLTNVLDEVSFPTLLLVIILVTEKKQVLLDSPIIFSYFLIIVVSALHLDFKLSFLTGLMAAIQHTGIVIYALYFVSGNQEYNVLLPHSIYFIRSLFFLVTGACAGFVALELKKRIISSFKSLYEKKEVELLFGQQVSPEIARALIDHQPGSSKVEATIMFLDIRNFSSFAELRDPQEVINFQNNVFSPLIDIINKYQGIVNQILGDGFMATFGAPIQNPDHRQNAIKAGYEILQKMNDMQEQKIIPKTRLGIGIHTGEVVTGNIGNDHRKQYSVSGSAVVIANRIEKLNKKYNTQFLSSYVADSNDFPNHFERLGQEKLKGIEQSVEIFKIA